MGGQSAGQPTNRMYKPLQRQSQDRQGQGMSFGGGVKPMPSTMPSITDSTTQASPRIDNGPMHTQGPTISSLTPQSSTWARPIDPNESPKGLPPLMPPVDDTPVTYGPKPYDVPAPFIDKRKGIIGQEDNYPEQPIRPMPQEFPEAPIPIGDQERMKFGQLARMKGGY